MRALYWSAAINDVIVAPEQRSVHAAARAHTSSSRSTLLDRDDLHLPTTDPMATKND
jgi:hypothetical protein